MDQNQQNGLWNAELRKKEREERLHELKRADGSKKPLSTGRRSWRILQLVIVVLLCLGILSWGVFTLGVPQKYLHVATVNGQKLSIANYNFIYNNIYSQFEQYVAQGLAPRNEQGSLDLNALYPFNTDPEKHQTWGEYIESSTLEALQRYALEEQLAKQAGTQIDEKEVKDFETSLEQQIQSSGGELAYENLLVSFLGKGATVDMYKKIILGRILANKYQSDYIDQYQVTDEQLEEEYKKDPTQYDVVYFREFILKQKELTEEEKALAEDEQNKLKEQYAELLKTEVDTFVSGAKTETGFINEAVAFSSEADKAKMAESSTTLRGPVKSGSLATDISAWAFSTERKAGDLNVFDYGSGGKRILYFLKRERPEEKQQALGLLIFSNNITVTDENREAATEALKQLKEKAESVRSELQASEESVNALAEKLKAEGLNVTGSWLRSADNSNIPTAVQDWLKEGTRKEGDTFLVEDEESSLVFVYVLGKQGDIVWKETIRSKLASEAYQKMLDEEMSKPENAIQVSSLGMYFTSPIAKGNLKGEDVYAAQQKAKEEEKASTQENTTSSSSDEASEAKTDSNTEAK